MHKYFLRYAEPESATARELPDAFRWAHVLVIPVCNESTGVLRSPPTGAGRSLLILVINQPPGAGHEVGENNRQLAAAIRKRFEPVWGSPVRSAEAVGPCAMQLFSDHTAERDILLIDRYSPGRELPPKGGVGHARKVGADVAAALIERGSIVAPWIHCSDGDVELPDTYFTAIETARPDETSCSALIYPFRHVAAGEETTDPGVLQATQLYECSLRYYRAGLGFAGSPYAFHTIGSTLAINAAHYASVRGFPRRNAGEDFYLLNKLAKVGTVRELEAGPGCRPIRIAARRSDRVPFGTGAAVGQMIDSSEPLEQHRFYHPAIFHLLKAWLASFDTVWDSRDARFQASVSLKRSDGVEGSVARRCLLDVLDELGAERAFQHAFAQSSDRSQFKRQMHTWFDAFRTLKLVHGLRQRAFASLPYRQLISEPMVSDLIPFDPGFERFEFQPRTGSGYND